MMFSPLQNRLLPNVSALPPVDISLALFPLRESFVTEHLILHKRFERRILQNVLANHDVELMPEAIPFKKEHILHAIMRAPLKTLFHSLGLSWNADIVAQTALKQKVGAHAYLHEFVREEIRFALKFRGMGNIDIDTVLDSNAILEDGMRCFAAWINDVPHDTQQLLVYTCNAKGFALPNTEMMSDIETERRTDLCTKWCEDRMASHLKDVPNQDTEEDQDT